MRILVSTRLLAEGFSELTDKYEVVFPEKDIFSKEDVINMIAGFDAFVSTFQFKISKS